MLDQRRRRWAVVVQIVYKCFVFSGIVDLNHMATNSSGCSKKVYFKIEQSLLLTSVLSMAVL